MGEKLKGVADMHGRKKRKEEEDKHRTPAAPEVFLDQGLLKRKERKSPEKKRIRESEGKKRKRKEGKKTSSPPTLNHINLPKEGGGIGIPGVKRREKKSRRKKLFFSSFTRQGRKEKNLVVGRRKRKKGDKRGHSSLTLHVREHFEEERKVKKGTDRRPVSSGRQEEKKLRFYPYLFPREKKGSGGLDTGIEGRRREGIVVHHLLFLPAYQNPKKCPRKGKEGKEKEEEEGPTFNLFYRWRKERARKETQGLHKRKGGRKKNTPFPSRKRDLLKSSPSTREKRGKKKKVTSALTTSILHTALKARGRWGGEEEKYTL